MSQCTHPLIKRAHFGPTLYAGLFHSSLAISVRNVRRYTGCTHKAWPIKVTVFSFFAHFYCYYLLLYLYYMTYRLLQNPAAVASSSSSSSPFLPIDSARDAYIKCIVTDSRRRSCTIHTDTHKHTHTHTR